MANPWEKYGAAQASDGPWAKYGSAAPQAAPPTPQQKAQIGDAGDRPIDAAYMNARGMTAGLMDYPAAAVDYAFDHLDKGKPSYEQSLRDLRGRVEQYRDENPASAYGNEIGGAVLSPIFRGVGALAEKGVNAGTRASQGFAQFMSRGGGKVAGNAAQGGSQGIVGGIGTAQNEQGGVPSMGDVGKSAGTLGVGGAGLSVALPAVAQGGAKVVQKATNWARPKPPAMTQPQIQAASRAAYKDAEAAGVVVKPDEFQKFADELPGKLEGYRPRLAPLTAKMIEEIQADVAAGKPVTLDLLDELRQVARGASKTMDRNEIRLISSIVDQLDTFVDDLKPHQLLAGDADAGAAALNKARSLYRTNMKLRNIDDIIEIGENLNDTNWTRNQFRAIVRKPKVFNGYTPEEQELIKQLAKTGKLENLARMQPLRGVQMAAPHIAQIGQDRTAAALQDLIARGGSTPASGPGIPPALLQFMSRNSAPAASPLLASSPNTGASNQRPYRER